METILAKISLFFAAILGLINPVYIQLGATNLTFDYKTGDITPIYYYLNIKNIGPQKERFDVSSSVPWIFVYREGQTTATSLQIEREGAVNFVLEIRPEMVSNGSHSGEVTVNAVDVYNFSVIESKKVNVALNKNVVVQTATLTPAVSTVLPSPIPSETTTLSPSPLLTPTAAIKPAPTRTRTVPPKLTASPSVSPTVIPGKVSPFPSPTIQPDQPSVEVQPPIFSKTRSIFQSIWSFFKELF